MKRSGAVVGLLAAFVVGMAWLSVAQAQRPVPERQTLHAPVFIGAAKARNTLDVAGAFTAASASLGAADALKGATTNNNAAAGNLGEFVNSLIAIGSEVSLTTATPANVTSISLTAGDWDVSGVVDYDAAGATRTATSAGIGTVTATVPADGSEAYDGEFTTTLTEKDSVSVPRVRMSLSSTTTVYLCTSATFSAGTVKAFGQLCARRVR